MENYMSTVRPRPRRDRLLNEGDELGLMTTRRLDGRRCVLTVRRFSLCVCVFLRLLALVFGVYLKF